MKSHTCAHPSCTYREGDFLAVVVDAQDRLAASERALSAVESENTTLRGFIVGMKEIDDTRLALIAELTGALCLAKYQDDAEDDESALTARLSAEIHAAWEWQYDECDHGTYAGGPSRGEPYAMCEIFARRIVSRLERVPAPADPAEKLLRDIFEAPDDAKDNEGDLDSDPPGYSAGIRALGYEGDG